MIVLKGPKIIMLQHDSSKGPKILRFAYDHAEKVSNENVSDPAGEKLKRTLQIMKQSCEKYHQMKSLRKQT